jgi:hypothetical protein
MDTLPQLELPEDWKRRTRVFVSPKKPCGVLAPMISGETYEADRRRKTRTTENDIRPGSWLRPGLPRILRRIG